MKISDFKQHWDLVVQGCLAAGLKGMPAQALCNSVLLDVTESPEGCYRIHLQIDPNYAPLVQLDGFSDKIAAFLMSEIVNEYEGNHCLLAVEFTTAQDQLH